MLQFVMRRFHLCNAGIHLFRQQQGNQKCRGNVYQLLLHYQAMCFSVSLRAAYKPFTPNLNSIFKFANFSLPFSLYSPQLKSHTNGSVIYCLLFLQRQECFHKQQSARRSRKASQFSLCTLLCHFRTKNRNNKHTHPEKIAALAVSLASVAFSANRNHFQFTKL